MTSLDPSHLPLLPTPHHPNPSTNPHHSAATHPIPLHLPGLPPTSTIRVPDLRFELAYLRSVQSYVPWLRGRGEVGGLGWEGWRGVGWVTLRDQVLSPLVQGMVLGFAGMVIFPLFAPIRTKFFAGIFGTAPPPAKGVPLADRPPLPGPVSVPWWHEWLRGVLPSKA